MRRLAWRIQAGMPLEKFNVYDLCCTPLISVKMCSAYMFVFMQIKSVSNESFARRLVFKQRHKVAWKWPIKSSFLSSACPTHVNNTYSGFHNYAIFLDLDEVAPVFTYCPSDITIENTTAYELRVTWQRPTATDNSGLEPVIHSKEQPGQVFDVPGSYEVLYTATDDSGNTATCSFRITLKRKYGASLFEAPR